MKHGRPHRLYEHKASGSWRYRCPSNETRAELTTSWRREHAHRVFAAIQALAMVADAWNRGAVYAVTGCDYPEWVQP